LSYNKLINWTHYGCHRFCKRKTWQKQRQPTRQLLGAVEPVFGNITVNKGMNKFTLRGQDKAYTLNQNQWKMYCLVHNIEKLRNSLH